MAVGSGLKTPAVTIKSTQFLDEIVNLFLDTSNNRLYVLAKNSQMSQVVILEGASKLSGAVSGRVRTFDGVGSGLFVDVPRNLLYVGHQVLVNASSQPFVGLSTTERISFAGAPTNLLVDTRANQLYYGEANNALVQTRPGGFSSALSSPLLQTGPGGLQSLIPDTSKPSLSAPGISQFFALCNGRLPSSVFHRISRMPNPFFFGPQPTLNFLAGSLSQLGNVSPLPVASQAGPMLADPFSGQIYAGNSVSTRLQVYTNLLQVNGDGAPVRTLDLGVVPTAIALDRTR